MEVMSMIDKFLHSNLFLLIFDLDFDRIQLAESLRIFLKVGSDFIQDTEPNFIFYVFHQLIFLHK